MPEQLIKYFRMMSESTCSSDMNEELDELANANAILVSEFKLITGFPFEVST